MSPTELPLDPAARPRKRELRRALSLVNWAWVYGAIWVTATSGAPLTQFARALGATEFQFGILAALPFLASLLSIPASALIDLTGRRKLIFLPSLYLQRTLWFAIALVPLWQISTRGWNSAPAVMQIFLLLILAMHCCQAIGGPAWTSWMADIVPDRIRGKYFSRRRQYGCLSAIPAAFLVGWILDKRLAAGDPMTVLRWCGGIFIVAAIFGTLDIHLFAYIREPRRKPHALEKIHHTLLTPLKNRSFMAYNGFVGMMTFAISFMAQFITLYLIQRLQITNLQTQLMLLVTPLIVQLAVFPIWGKAADRFGKKPLLTICALGMIPQALGWCFLSSGHLWLGYVLSGMAPLFWTGVEVVNLNVVLELSEAGEDGGGGSSGFIAINSVVINIAGCIGGLAGGAIAQALKDWTWTLPWLKTFTYYDVLWILSAATRLAALLIFVPRIIEPGIHKTHEALRFMTTNINNNLFAAILQPVRMIEGLIRDDPQESQSSASPPSQTDSGKDDKADAQHP